MNRDDLLTCACSHELLSMQAVHARGPVSGRHGESKDVLCYRDPSRRRFRYGDILLSLRTRRDSLFAWAGSVGQPMAHVLPRVYLARLRERAVLGRLYLRVIDRVKGVLFGSELVDEVSRVAPERRRSQPSQRNVVCRLLSRPRPRSTERQRQSLPSLDGVVDGVEGSQSTTRPNWSLWEEFCRC